MEVKTKFSPLTKVAAVATVYALTAPVHADAISDLTDSVDFASVITGVMAIAASILALYLALKGAQIILKKVKGA
ncbi:hypothetical protein ACFQ0F_08375 [Paraperlucidibaca wandonensis]|uniref:Phage coat protein n=1 Tax=Paraperlucidibaca wandonensis TaxID=1268273 RepID=A0ABW3HGL3_9GAMM